MDVKNFLFKEACRRTKFDIRSLTSDQEIKQQLLSDGLFRVAFLDKEAMPLMKGTSQFAYAANIEFEDFPFDDHSRIASIQNAVREKFVPLLVYRLKTEQGDFVQIDLREILGKKDDPRSPFYIRLKFRKHILPPHSADAIKTNMAEISPELVDLVEKLNDTSIGVLPYYNKTEQNKRDAILDFAKSMISIFAENTSLPQHLKYFWAKRAEEITTLGNDWPKLFGQVSRREYSRSIIRKSDEIDQMRNTFELLWSIHYAENPPKKPGLKQYRIFDPSPQVLEEKREKLKQFLINEYVEKANKIQQSPAAQNDKVDYQTLSSSKAQESFQRIWNVFSTDPKTRDVSKMQLRGGAPEPYDKLTQNDLRSILKFLQVPELRFHAVPRKFPNGLDMDHLYPPLEYSREEDEFRLDFKSGNLGLVECKRNLDDVIFLLEKFGQQFSNIFNEILEADDLPDDIASFTENHTGADNLPFFFDTLRKEKLNVEDAIQKMKNSPVSEIYYGLHDMLEKIRSSYGDHIAGWIVDYLNVKFANRDVKKIKARESYLAKEKPDFDFWQKDKAEIENYAHIFHDLIEEGHVESAALAAQLLKTQPLGMEANVDAIRYAPMLHSFLAQHGYKTAKVLDLINYLVLKHTEDPIFGVRGRNYSTGGITGEILLGIEYASNVPLRKIHHGEEANIQALELQGKDPFGTSLEQLRQSPYAPHVKEQIPVMPSEKPIKPEAEQTYAGIKSVKLMPTISYTVLQTSKSEKGMLRSTRYRKKQLEVEDEGLGTQMQETGYIGENKFDTLEEAMTKLENLYPGAKDFLGDRFELINQRMDLASKRIRQAIETAIELREADIKAATGFDIHGETGDNIQQSLINLNKDIAATQDKIYEDDPHYFDQAKKDISEKEEPLYPVDVSDLLDLAQADNADNESFQILLGMDKAKQWDAIKTLKHDGIVGDKIYDLFYTVFEGQSSSLWLAEEFGKFIMHDPEYPEHVESIKHQEVIESLGQGNPIAEKIALSLLKQNAIETLNLLEKEQLVGDLLAKSYSEYFIPPISVVEDDDVFNFASYIHDHPETIKKWKRKYSIPASKKTEFDQHVDQIDQIMDELGDSVPEAQEIVKNIFGYLGYGSTLRYILEELLSKGYKGQALYDFYFKIIGYSQINAKGIAALINFISAGSLPLIPLDHHIPPSEPNEKKEGSLVSRLVKIADRFDKKGFFKLSDKIDVLISKIEKNHV